MKKINIPFQIDSQYENWQFELEVLNDRLVGYHSYKYIGKKFNFFLEFSTNETELIFNGDVLTAVILTFRGKNKPNLKALQEVLVSVGFKSKLNTNSYNYFEFRKRLYCIKNSKNQIVSQLVYGKSSFIRKLNLIL